MSEFVKSVFGLVVFIAIIFATTYGCTVAWRKAMYNCDKRFGPRVSITVEQHQTWKQ